MLKDNIMVMASEVGVYDTDPENVALKVRSASALGTSGPRRELDIDPRICSNFHRVV